MAAPAETQRHVRKVDVRIHDVDTARFTARVQHLRGEHMADDVPWESPYVANRGGGFMGAIPEPGDVATMESGSGSSSWRITGYVPLPRVDEDGASDEPRSNFAAGRATAFPGDMGAWGSAGNRVVVRRSGVTEVVADEITWSRYFPREHLIRHSAATIETQGVFGTSSWYTARDEAREEAGSTPTGFSAWVKTHAEASPNVNVEMGAVLDDEELRLPGRPQRHDRRRGRVCLRVLAFDQPFADRYAALGRPPDPSGARLALRADEEGNVQWLQAGQLTQTVGNETRHVVGRSVTHVGGRMQTHVVGDYDVESAGAVRVAGGRGVHLSSPGDVTIDCARFTVRADNDRIRTRNDYTIDAGGSFRVKSGGAATLSSAAGMEIVSGDSTGHVVGGRYTLDVLASSEAENRGKDVRAWGVTVHKGKAALRAVDGSFEIAIGPQRNPKAVIRLHGDPRIPTQVGRITVGFPSSGYGITLSPNGDWSIEGKSGGVRCDAAGRIQLGDSRSPVAGYLVSTLTHPVDFVTGAPIMGHSSLLASPSSPASMTGAASQGVQPPTQTLPEEVAS